MSDKGGMKVKKTIRLTPQQIEYLEKKNIENVSEFIRTAIDYYIQNKKLVEAMDSKLEEILILLRSGDVAVAQVNKPLGAEEQEERKQEEESQENSFLTYLADGLTEFDM